MEQLSITNSFISAINNIFASFFSSIDSTFYLLLDDLIFIDIDILYDSLIYNFIGTLGSPGLVTICTSLLIGLLLYYGVSLLLSYLTFSEVQKPSQFVFKIVFCSILITFSKKICYCFIFFFSNISLGIRFVGEELLKTEICFTSLIETLNSSFALNSQSFNLFSFDGLIKSLISFGFINLAISYSLRYIMIQVFSIITPFAILCLCINKFSWIFKAWLKIYLSLLFLQILVAVILLVVFSLRTYEPGNFTSLLYLGSIYALIKANSFIRDFMGGISTDVSAGISSVKSLLSKNN